MLTSTIIRLKTLLFRRRADAELSEEIALHVEREAERNVALGMSADEAHRAARRALGNITVATEQARDAWRWTSIEELRQDVTYALRTFARAPTFVVTVVATIGLGLGLLTASFTVFEAYVLRPNTVRDPNSLYDVSWHTRSGMWQRLRWKDYRALDARRDVFVDAYASLNLQARLRGTPVIGQLVTGNYFRMLAVPPALGRTLLPEDSDAPGGSPVIVLSHDTWRSVFGGDSSIIGRVVPLNGIPHRVVGIAREGFGGLESIAFQFWAPITMVSALDPPRDIFRANQPAIVRMIARLRPNVTDDHASVALLTTFAALTSDEPPPRRVQDVVLESRATSFPLTKEVIAAATPLAIAFVLVMLIACANVANVMLARGMARQREIGIRLSLGAARGRLVRQLLTESVVLAVPSALAGYAISRAAISFGIYIMYAAAPPAYRAFLRPISLATDASIVVFTMFAAVIAAVGFGLAPALQATRPSVVHATRGDFDSHLRPSKMRSTLVVSQVAVSALLLICASILLGAARETRARDPGMRTHNLVQLVVVERARGMVLDELRAMPGTRAIASATSAPLDGIFPAVRVVTSSGETVPVKFNVVSRDYFSAIDLPIRRGRVFTDDEARGRVSVAMVSEATAAALWPGRDPIGEHIRQREPDGALSRYRDATVIGVVRDARPGWIGLPADIPVVYYPQPIDAATSNIIARTTDESEATRAEIERVVAKRDSSAIREAHTIEAALGLQLYPFEMAYWTAAIVGAIALLLTVTGVYGVLAYVVAQRRREFGVRLALGANPAGIVAMMLRHLGRLAMIGLVIGTSLALISARALVSIRYVIDVYDARGFAFGAGVVFVSCLAAAYMPARGAGRVDPIEALRAD